VAAQTFSTSLNMDAASKLGLVNGDDVTINTISRRRWSAPSAGSWKASRWA